MKFLSFVVGACSAHFSVTSAITISQINGRKYLSSYNGQPVTSVKGLVTPKGPSGFWIKSTTIDLSYKSSNSIYLFGNSTLKGVNVDIIITLDATVTEYRSSPDYLYLTELASPANITVLSAIPKHNFNSIALYTGKYHDLVQQNPANASKLALLHLSMLKT